MLYIADTHSLIWFLTDSGNLSKRAKGVFDGVEKGKDIIIIPTIVLAELLYLCEKKKIEEKFNQIIKIIKNGSNYSSYDLDLEIIEECQTLIKIKEIHDKIIVATTKILNGILITKDSEIISSKYVETVW